MSGNALYITRNDDDCYMYYAGDFKNGNTYKEGGKYDFRYNISHRI